MTNLYYRVPITVNVEDSTLNYGIPLSDILDSKLDGKSPPQQALVMVENPLTVGVAVTEAQFDAGFMVDNPAVLAPVEFIGLLQAAGGLTQAQLNAFALDPAMAGLRLVFTVVRDGLERDNVVTTNALAELVTGTYLTAAGSAAVIANWPQQSP